MTNATLSDYLTLCKPKVVLLMLLTVWVGMHLASDHLVPCQIFVFGSLGIAFAAGSAAIINHLVDRHIDAKMTRTASRPIASGRISPAKAIGLALLLSFMALILLITFVNPITTILTFSTMLGYAVLYTIYLKRATPQNIVIGGLAGAMPPLLGWAAVSGNISPNSLLLVLIIFVWTPPHFWALAIYRRQDYRNANIPMLPVTHGVPFSKLCILLYTALLFAVTCLPFAVGMSGIIYLVSALALNIFFLYQALTLYKASKQEETLRAIHTFNYSIAYILLLFTALLVDHYLLVFTLHARF